MILLAQVIHYELSAVLATLGGLGIAAFGYLLRAKIDSVDEAQREHARAIGELRESRAAVHERLKSLEERK